MEIWKEVEGYEGKYFVSSEGRVKNSRGRFLSLNTNTNGGYRRVTLYKNGTPTTIMVHRLVGLHFIPNPNNLPVLNHILPVSEGGSDSISNLEWVTHKENTQHALKRGNMRTKKIAQLDKDGNIVAEFFGAREAQRQTGILHITEVANGTRATAGGYKWKYID